MATISYDSSARFGCKTHGKLASSMFIRADAGEHFSAFYACLVCVREVVGDAQTCTRPQVDEIQEKGYR